MSTAIINKPKLYPASKELVVVLSTTRNNKAKKKQFGNLDFENGSMKVFVGYHECQDGTSKILLDLDEVRELTTRYGRPGTLLRLKAYRGFGKGKKVRGSYI